MMRYWISVPAKIDTAATGIDDTVAFASVVAPIACLAGLEVCGVCGPTCDAVCTH